MKSKSEAAGRAIIKIINSIVDFATFLAILLLLVFAVYALWDTEQIYSVADKSLFKDYKPSTESGMLSFMELQAINPEVIAWLHVYGTNIDYPVAQGPNNMKYVNTSIMGTYSMSGAIFLDYGNSKDFSDFNSIVYGHNMEKRVMFGDIRSFADKGFFDTHRYGDLYYDEQNHGIDFFAYVHTDAYDYSVFTLISQEAKRQPYIDNLFDLSINSRDFKVTPDDRIILLSTCSSSSTNGRDILAGIITDETYEDQP